MLLTPAHIKPNRLNQDGTLFLPGVDAPHVYHVRAWALGCFYSHIIISTQTFWRALTASVDSCAELRSAPSVA